MNKDILPNYHTDWKGIITTAFFEAWKNNSLVDISDYAYKIGSHFNLEMVVKNLQIRLMDAEDPVREIRYHTDRIKILTKTFVLALLETSDDGKMFSAHNIEKAKQALLKKAPCDYE